MTQFKDGVGRWLTVGLFKETASQTKFVQWTLEEAKQLYLATEDITGYTFASTHLGGWPHWVALKESPTLEGILASWEEEMEVMLRSKGLREIVRKSTSDKGYQAAKFLTEGGWKPKEMGRPTRERVERESRIRNKMYDEFGDNILELRKK